MPYTWIEPDIFLSHKGIDVYYLYIDDCVDNPQREYWYGFYSNCSDGLAEGSFDIREVIAVLPPATRALCGDDHAAICTALIDIGVLTNAGFIIDGLLCDNANTIREAVEEHSACQADP